jgi:iron complex outermembrane receptor protein
VWSKSRIVLRARWRACLFALTARVGTGLVRADESPVQHVTVQARPLVHAERAPTLASSVLQGDALKSAGASSAELLARVPGVQVTRTGAQSDLATASIRGADAQQVPVYLAGVRVNDDVSGTADLSTIPLWLIDRVEVFRGNAPEEADRLGLGGAIFFWPRLPRASRRSMGGEWGSFGQYGGWASIEAGTERQATLMALRASGATNDYSFIDDQGQRFDLIEREQRRQNADYSELDAWLMHHHRLGARARMSSVLYVIDREQGITGLSVVPARQARARTERWLFGNSIVVPCDTSSSCRLELSSTLVSAGSRLTDPLVELPTLRTRQLDSAGERVSHGIRLQLDLTPDLRVALGLGVSLDNIRVDRAGTLPRRGNRRSLLPKLSATYQVSTALSLHALAAAECHWTRGVIVRLGRQAFQDTGPCGWVEPIGRLGARYDVSDDLALLSNVSRYVRMPTLSELYGTAPLVDGNAGLQPEKGLSWDAGLRWSPRLSDTAESAVSLEVFGFARSVDQIIRFRRSAVESLAPFNVAAARILGLEWAAGADLLRHVHLETAGAILDPRETTKDPRLDPTVNDILTHTSRLTLSGSAELYADRPWPELGVQRAALRLNYLHRSSRFADVAGQNVLPAQHFVDVEISSSLLAGQLLARLASRNLLDNRTSDVIGLPVPGRSYHVTAEAWF